MHRTVCLLGQFVNTNRPQEGKSPRALLWCRGSERAAARPPSSPSGYFSSWHRSRASTLFCADFYLSQECAYSPVIALNPQPRCLVFTAKRQECFQSQALGNYRLNAAKNLRDLNQGLLGIFFLDVYECPDKLCIYWLSGLPRERGIMGLFLCWETYSDPWLTTWVHREPLSLPTWWYHSAQHLEAPTQTEGCTPCHIPVLSKQHEALWLHLITSLMWLC